MCLKTQFNKILTIEQVFISKYLNKFLNKKLLHFWGGAALVFASRECSYYLIIVSFLTNEFPFIVTTAL